MGKEGGLLPRKKNGRRARKELRKKDVPVENRGGRGTLSSEPGKSQGRGASEGMGAIGDTARLDGKKGCLLERSDARGKGKSARKGEGVKIRGDTTKNGIAVDARGGPCPREKP